MKILIRVLLALSLLVVGFLAFSHRILPADVDECQRDVSHIGHVSELPVFHCIGHSETDRETASWDHLHPWMNEEWHRTNGFRNGSSEPAE